MVVVKIFQHTYNFYLCGILYFYIIIDCILFLCSILIFAVDFQIYRIPEMQFDNCASDMQASVIEPTKWNGIAWSSNAVAAFSALSRKEGPSGTFAKMYSNLEFNCWRNGRHTQEISRLSDGRRRVEYYVVLV